jgi:hypothetical protein
MVRTSELADEGFFGPQELRSCPWKAAMEGLVESTEGGNLGALSAFYLIAISSSLHPPGMDIVGSSASDQL